MDVMEQMAEEYPDIYFCHGTGYKSNGKILRTISDASIRQDT